MNIHRVLLPLILIASATSGAESLRWVKFDHHTHLKPGPFFGGDGSATLEQQQRAAAAAGIELIVNAAHSDFGTNATATARWLKQKAYEEQSGRAGPVRSMGEELRVEPGPLYSGGQQLFGVRVPENKEHLGLVGISGFVAHLSPMAVACDRAHQLGGVVILNHPGPGPGMWEPGYWDRLELRVKLDGLEIYNDRATRAAGVAFDYLYRQAIAYSGYGLKIAAIGASDSHGVNEPMTAATMALARECSITAVVEAIRARHTVAISGFPRLEMECAHLGEVVRGERAELSLRLREPVERITLFRETKPLQTWTNAATATVTIPLTENATFSWSLDDGARHACTSGIWFEPKPAGSRVDGGANQR